MRTYKTEINPIDKQKQIINRTIGVSRFIYNFYLEHNKEVYEKGQKFVSGKDFSKWLNNKYLPNNPDKSWIKEVYAKAVKQSIMNAEKAYKNFFTCKPKFPKFKKKNKSDVKMYFVKNSATQFIKCERHRIKIPTLGFVQLKEKGYIPLELIIKSGTVSKKVRRYYVSALVEVPDITQSKKNINKTPKVKKIEKKLKR